MTSGPGDVTGKTREFWDSNPCGSLTSAYPRGTREFFEEVARRRYQEETYIEDFARFQEHAGERMLEIGVGAGSDASRFAAAGARYFAADLSGGSLRMTKDRFALFGLKGGFVNASATELPYATGVFDTVYCHGVLHHIPDARAVCREVARVLKPGGKFFVAVYHKHSLAYYWNILIINGLLKGKIWRKPMPQLIADFTDGEGNPYALLYTRESLTGLLRDCGLQVAGTRTYYVSHNLLFAPFGKYVRRSRLPAFLVSILESLAKRWGWMLTTVAQKPQ